jgi:arabinose-5-phosphate isomerase
MEDIGQTEIIEAISVIKSSIKGVNFRTNQSFQNYLESVDIKNLRIFSTGVGASGVPARVLSHALASMGVSGSDADPIELLHGGFGRIKQGDLLICFSDSGETKEILRILRHANKLGICTILVTQNKLILESELSNYVINYSLGNTGEIIRGVPSTSLVAQILVSLGLCEYLTRKSTMSLDSKSHPLGMLGLQNSKVKEIMREVEIDLVGDCELTMEQALKMINKNRLGVLLFISSSKGMGVFTDGDLRRALVSNSGNADEFLGKSIEEFINFNPKYLSPEDSLKSANDFFESGKKILVAPVIQEGNLVGVLHVHDLLEAIG